MTNGASATRFNLIVDRRKRARPRHLRSVTVPDEGMNSVLKRRLLISYYEMVVDGRSSQSTHSTPVSST